MAKPLALLIALLAGLPTQAVASSSIAAMTDADAQRLLGTYVQTWSRDNAITPETLALFYDDQVVFYGKQMPRSAILREKQRYIAVWPERSYWIVPGTVSMRCNVGRSSCAVTGLMGWNRRSSTGARSIGEAQLSLVVTGQSNGKIVRESARIVRERAD